MNTFEWVQAGSPKEAVSLLTGDFDKVKIIAGGMDLVTELKEHLVESEKLVDISGIKELHYIKESADGIKIGANTTLAEIERHDNIAASYKAFADAARSVGSPQIRNAGTIGGNLCQRPRCWYYRGEHYKCLKKGGAICFAVTGNNRYNAIFGGGPSYIVHPSDCATALAALGATVHILGPEGERSVAIENFFTLPASNLRRENVLKSNEIVTEIELPKNSMKSTYLKFKEKDSYDWAISAVAVGLEMDGKTCKKASVVLGGVAPIPWRSKEAEAVLNGQPVTAELAEKAGKEAVKNAEPMSDNVFKVTVIQNLVKQAIMELV